MLRKAETKERSSRVVDDLKQLARDIAEGEDYVKLDVAYVAFAEKTKTIHQLCLELRVRPRLLIQLWANSGIADILQDTNKAYLAKEKSTTQIAEELGMSRKTIYAAWRKRGFKTGIQMDRETMGRTLDAYERGERTAISMAQELGISYKSLIQDWNRIAPDRIRRSGALPHIANPEMKEKVIDAYSAYSSGEKRIGQIAEELGMHSSTIFYSWEKIGLIPTRRKKKIPSTLDEGMIKRGMITELQETIHKSKSKLKEIGYSYFALLEGNGNGHVREDDKKAVAGILLKIYKDEITASGLYAKINEHETVRALNTETDRLLVVIKRMLDGMKQK